MRQLPQFWTSLNKTLPIAPSRGIEPSRIRGLLFDVDGTLSDTDDHMVQQISGFLQPLSWLFKDRNPRKFSRGLVMFSETPGNFLYSIADRVGLDAIIASFYNWLAQQRSPQPVEEDEFQIIPGVKEMLAALADRYPMAVVSARDARSTGRFLDFFDLLNHCILSPFDKCRPLPDFWRVWKIT